VKRGVLPFALLAASIPRQAGPEELAPLPPATVQAIAAAVSATMEKEGIPGLTAALVVDARLRWSQGYGVADVETGVPATADTVYRLASVSKPITAVAVMQLVEKGSVDLDASVRTYVPSFPPKPWPITTRQLLAHTSGIRHYQGDEFASTRHYWSVLEGLDVFKEDPLMFEPGTRQLYSTYGYTLLGAVVEAASGMRYLDYLREKVFEPAGMTSARDDDLFPVIRHRAQGYVRTAAGDLRNAAPADTSYKLPGGGLCATAADLGRFAAALEAGVLLKKESLRAMLVPQRIKSGGMLSYGLGWSVTTRDGRTEVWHTGAQQRVSSLLYLQPERGFAVALMANLENEGTSLKDLARRIAAIVQP